MALDEGTRSSMAASTAEGAASMRAAGSYLRDPAIRCPDRFATRFVPLRPKLTALSRVPVLRGLLGVLAERMLPGGYGYEIARIRYMDEVLLDAVADGAEQVLILGAGFDSRAYRLRRELVETAIFEADHPLTQQVKRARLDAMKDVSSDHVRFVAVDLLEGDLGDTLAAAGWAPSRRSVVIYSGVSMYLEARGNENVMTFMAAQAPGSVVTFDYVDREALDGDHSGYGAKELSERVASVGEPLRFGLPRDGVRGWLADRGLEIVEHCRPEEITARYLTRSNGQVWRRPYGCGGLVCAKVPA